MMGKGKGKEAGSGKGKGKEAGVGKGKGKDAGLGKGKGKDRGFTLIEVLTTVVIVFVGAVFIHQGLIRCLEGMKRSERVLEETMTEQNKAHESLLEAAASNSSVQTR